MNLCFYKDSFLFYSIINMKNLKTTRTGFEYWKFEFVCNSRGNRSGFVHEGSIYFWNNFYPSNSYKIQYYNRTREARTYQSLCRNLFFDFLSNKSRSFIEQNKDDILAIAEDLDSDFWRIFRIMNLKQQLLEENK